MNLCYLYEESDHLELSEDFTTVELAIGRILLAMHDIGDTTASDKLLSFRKEFNKYATATSEMSAELVIWCDKDDPHVIADSIKEWKKVRKLED